MSGRDRSFPRPGRLRTWLAGLLVVALLLVLAFWPVTTRRGVDYQQSSETIRLLEKGIDFLSRDLQTKRLVRRITGGSNPDDRVLLDLFEWVGAHVQPIPHGLPVVDDHIHHIIIRGYGTDDQRTEVFTMLANYAGMRAGMVISSGIFAIVEMDRRRYVFDVPRGIAFQTPDGRLADAEEIERDRGLLHTSATRAGLDPAPYAEAVLAALRERPNFERMNAQRPIRRLRLETTRFVFRRDR